MSLVHLACTSLAAVAVCLPAAAQCQEATRRAPTSPVGAGLGDAAALEGTLRIDAGAVPSGAAGVIQQSALGMLQELQKLTRAAFLQARSALGRKHYQVTHEWRLESGAEDLWLGRSKHAETHWRNDVAVSLALQRSIGYVERTRRSASLDILRSRRVITDAYSVLAGDPEDREVELGSSARGPLLGLELEVPRAAGAWRVLKNPGGAGDPLLGAIEAGFAAESWLSGLPECDAARCEQDHDNIKITDIAWMLQPLHLDGLVAARDLQVIAFEPPAVLSGEWSNQSAISACRKADKGGGAATFHVRGLLSSSVESTDAEAVPKFLMFTMACERHVQTSWKLAFDIGGSFTTGTLELLSYELRGDLEASVDERESNEPVLARRVRDWQGSIMARGRVVSPSPGRAGSRGD